jgi:UDP-N-acetylmuramoyl-tripeptide--D-alanyl-D-alanine ligase
MKYSLAYLASLINYFYADPIPIQGVCVDSRLSRPNELFVALPGEKTDGHNFLSQAAGNGCAAAIVSKEYQGPDYGLHLLRVENPLLALQEMAHKRIASGPYKIVAITGSVGKTTTKDFAAALLRTKYRVAASPGTSNSQIGLPLSILNHTEGNEDVLVLEMGMTEPRQIARLVEIAPPDIALITQTALAHACNFDSLEQIGMAKGEIFTHPKTKIGILDRRIQNYDTLCAIGHCKKVSFAVDCPNADFTLQMDVDKILIKDAAGSHFVSLLSVPGHHNRHNFLAAAIAARCLNVDWELINGAISSLSLPENRFQTIKKKGVLFINDSYNASEVSVKAAIESLPAPAAGGKRIAVLGEMLELGKFSLKCHREVGEFALKYVDTMICLGEECKVIYDVWKTAGRNVQWFQERLDLVNALNALLQTGDVVLLKGSRATGLSKILNEL